MGGYSYLSAFWALLIPQPPDRSGLDLATGWQTPLTNTVTQNVDFLMAGMVALVSVALLVRLFSRAKKS